MLIILTLNFIQGHTDLNHENNKCLIISETIQAKPIIFAVKIVWIKVYMTIATLMTLTFIQDHKCLKLHYCLTCNILDNTITFKHGKTVELLKA